MDRHPGRLLDTNLSLVSLSREAFEIGLRACVGPYLQVGC